MLHRIKQLDLQIISHIGTQQIVQGFFTSYLIPTTAKHQIKQSICQSEKARNGRVFFISTKEHKHFVQKFILVLEENN